MSQLSLILQIWWHIWCSVKHQQLLKFLLIYIYKLDFNLKWNQKVQISSKIRFKSLIKLKVTCHKLPVQLDVKCLIKWKFFDINLCSHVAILSSGLETKFSQCDIFLAPTGALVVAPLPLFHITSSRFSKYLYTLLTLLKSLDHFCPYIYI